MYQKRQKVNIDDTRFIYTTNFSGDPARDRFGSDKRRVNVVIPTVEQAMDMRAMGINVKETHPNPNYTKAKSAEKYCKSRSKSTQSAQKRHES